MYHPFQINGSAFVNGALLIEAHLVQIAKEVSAPLNISYEEGSVGGDRQTRFYNRSTCFGSCLCHVGVVFLLYSIVPQAALHLAAPHNKLFVSRDRQGHVCMNTYNPVSFDS